MTDELSENLRKLDEFLCSGAVSDDAMLLSELDGFLAGVVVCPDLIKPSEWLSVIWGGESPEFDSQHQAQGVIDLIMKHYNGIIRQLDRGEYSPLYDIDVDDSILWETWVEGFFSAMELRPGAWIALAEDDDEDLQRALFVLGRLGDLAAPPYGGDPMDSDAVMKEYASDLIPMHVALLHETRLRKAAKNAPFPNAPFPLDFGPKVGRNDPCPCGSGKKFKKCCLH